MTGHILSLELGSDEHGFVIEGSAPALPSAPVLPENTLLAWWPEKDPDLSGFLVKTGSQWGPFGVVLQLLDAAPGPPADEWEDVVELSVDVAGELTVGEIVDGRVGSVPVPPGGYRLRVSARGRTESAIRDREIESADGAAGSPVEHFLVCIWPAAPSGPAIVREDSRFSQERVESARPQLPADPVDGRAAALAIVREIQYHARERTSPSQLTSLTVEVDVFGRPARVFNQVQHVFGWPPCRSGISGPDPMATMYHAATLPDDSTDYAHVGHIATTLVEVDKPRRVVKRWNWVPEAPGPVMTRPLLLADDSLVTITVERLSGGDNPRTRVRLTQDEIPQAWVEHLEKLWAWHIRRTVAR